MDYFEAIVLGLIQGLGEFLPISSSGHLRMAEELFNMQEVPPTFDVALHMGTLLAVVAYFWKDWLSLLKNAVTRKDAVQQRLFWLLVLGTIPAALAGVLLGDLNAAVNTPVVAVMLIVFGVLLYVADLKPQKRKMQDITIKDTVIMGFAQAVAALFPGVSRSGGTMTAGRFLGLNREGAARFSFLLSAPIIFGAGVFELRHVEMTEINGPFVVGILVSAVVGLLSISLFLDFLKRFSFKAFMVYRIVIGVAALIAWFVLNPSAA